MASTSSSPDIPYEIPEPTIAIPAVSRSGKLIEYSSSALPSLGSGAPSPSEYIKKFSGPPSPAKRPLRSKKVTLAPKKKAKMMAVALPVPATLADLDAAVDAVAEEVSDTESLVRPSVDATTVSPTVDHPAPAAAIPPVPPSPASPSGPSPKSSTKRKRVAHRYPRPATTSAQDLPKADVNDPIDLPADVQVKLRDILARLDYPINMLSNGAGPIRSRIKEVQDQLPDDLIDAIAPVGYIEIHRLPVIWAHRRIEDRASQVAAQAKVEADREKAVSEKAKLDELQSAALTISAHIADLESRKAALEAQLAQVAVDLAIERTRLTDLPSVIAARSKA
ncbi:uncharacterized protein LOC121053502 [Oryza brachyantha]|uniref:uncharacterized protein LOC121053502 n=1 Tax=Oryza brachyantha TaxID=4533 RepID=UPI001ADB8906|nr:uncharacterized protein LOC121053502 [Oryza brachyantha]